MSVKEILERVEIAQNWHNYTASEHEIWSRLYSKQIEILGDIACDEFLNGLQMLDLNHGGIPEFQKLNPLLSAQTGWEIIAVEGLINDDDFFELLANRIFPAGQFIRKPEQFEYISEPDIFHDVFGHVPLLTNPIFADYMQAYGQGGMRAMGRENLKELARLYWYTVEFGLIKSAKGFKIYGAGILSSPLESLYSVESLRPNRIHFDLERIMKTDYIIDHLQQTYFVINSFQELFDATLQDFGAIYDKLIGETTLSADAISPQDFKY